MEDPELLQTVAAVATQLGGLLQRKRTEEALRISEAKNRALLDAIPDGLFRLSAEGVYLEYLPAESFEPLVPPEAFLGKRIEDVMPPDVARQQRHHLSLAVRTGTPQAYDIVLTQGGEPRHFETRLMVSGPDEVLAIVRDVTEMQRAEAALVAEKERLAVTLRSIGEGVIATDDQGTIVLANPVAETLTGWADAQAEGRPVGDVFRLLQETTREPVENPVERVLRTGERVDLSGGPSLLVARQGQERIVAHSAAPIRDRAGNLRGVVLVFGDITDQRRIEEELARASKLESIGVLAGGIAHDFNNLLAAVLANVSLVRMRIDPADKASERLALAETAVLRAKDLTQRLLTFAEGGAPVRKRTVIDALVREHTGFALAGSNVRAEFAFPEDLWPAEVDAGQLGQVIQNLVLNAQQAMPGGGTVRVRVENVRIPAGDSVPLAAGPYLKASVSDDGEGIPAERLEHLFDPFYSTKPNHTGLGLSTVYSIVRKHGGHVVVESTPGLGSTFTVFLPAARPSPPTPLPEGGRGAGDSPPPAGGKGWG